MGELVLITGTSSGIGLSTAVACARAGHTVVATMRNLEGRKALEAAAKEAGVPVAVEHLDVTSGSCVESAPFVRASRDEEGLRLDLAATADAEGSGRGASTGRSRSPK